MRGSNILPQYRSIYGKIKFHSKVPVRTTVVYSNPYIEHYVRWNHDRVHPELLSIVDLWWANSVEISQSLRQPFTRMTQKIQMLTSSSHRPRLNSCRPRPGISKVMVLKQKRINLLTQDVRLVIRRKFVYMLGDALIQVQFPRLL